ncbi:hypothetical protein OPT61_g10676 [Boeremia exigua]|uniref:Uncharacterized protein n=1 Tax=Boeremia exigua TaxID=749465 RepID=A0ACC2HPA8_9PLEO|nr:hypothetical protein OPT61_g10676 [Boeremia exigua]
MFCPFHLLTEDDRLARAVAAPASAAAHPFLCSVDRAQPIHAGQLPAEQRFADQAAPATGPAHSQRHPHRRPFDTGRGEPTPICLPQPTDAAAVHVAATLVGFAGTRLSNVRHDLAASSVACQWLPLGSTYS